MTKWPTLAALSFLAAGCVHASLATEAPTAAIRSAEEAGATEVPTAAYHVLLAKAQLAYAEALADRWQAERARSVLLRATADAELAIVLAHAEQARVAAAQAEARILTLQGQLP